MAIASKTPRAERDLAELWHFIAIDNQHAADRLIDSIIIAANRLAEHPGLGPARPEFGRTVRSFPVGNYILYYRPNSDGIQLLRVIHGARNTRDLYE